MEHKINTKFNIGDKAYGFIDSKLYQVVVDRIEINVALYGTSDKPIHTYKPCYLATPIDKSRGQSRFYGEDALFKDKEELLNHINKLFNNA